MIKENSQKKQEKEIQEKNTQIQELQVYKDLHFLKDDPYFRQQILILLERLVVATEKQADATESLSTHSLEDDEEEEEEE